MVNKVESGFLTSPDEVEGFHWDVLRPLSDEEFTALKHGIAEDGIVSSIVLDKDGNILDGGHRLKAWKELLEEGYDIPRAPVQIRHDIGSEDENAARLLARKLNMQRRQLSQLEKNDVVREQLVETWHRSDSWIAEDLGVHRDRVKARRQELISTGRFGLLPETVVRRDGKEQTYAPRKPLSKPNSAQTKGSESAPKQPPESPDSAQTTIDEQVEASTPDAPKTVSEALDTALSQIEESGAVPEDAPSWPTHPSQQTESKEAKRILQISAWMSGLSEFDPEEAAELVSSPSDIDARLAVAEEVIDWFEKYRDALQERRGQTTLRAVQ